jgi:hypothetical protein
MKSISTVKKVLLFGICAIVLPFVGLIADDIIFYLAGVPIIEIIFSIVFAFYATGFVAIIFWLLVSIIVGIRKWRRTKRIKHLLSIPGITWLILLSPAILIFMLSIAHEITESLNRFIPVVGEIEFARFIKGKTLNINRDSSVYAEYILVKNMPKDGLKQSKIMVAYFDSVGLSLNYFMTKMPEIKYYYMHFYKSTYVTRKYFKEASKDWTNERNLSSMLVDRFVSNEPETYLGKISMFRCRHDLTKWAITTGRKTGVSIDDHVETETVILLDGCDSYWSEVKENKELVKYYTELRDKNNAKD